MNGILLVDKPKGWTSFDVVAKVRGVVRTELRKDNPQIKNYKVGHTGTLDPSATGLLVLCLGKATKLVPTMIKHDKTYEVEMKLGSKSTTGDQEGEITQTANVEEPFPERAIIELLKDFKGQQMQTPPAFSAIKINGKRAYDLARAGKEVKLEPRPITIQSITLDRYDHPFIGFTCTVSSGTYIRSLVEDVGAKIGLDAYMSDLRRTRVAEYEVKDALRVEELNIENIRERCIEV
jgi:tRNA pseudouridine55 synthase